MAEALEIWVGYLVSELLTHADIFLDFRQLAGAIAFLAVKPIADFFRYRLIGVKIYLHLRTLLYFIYLYFTIFSL